MLKLELLMFKLELLMLYHKQNLRWTLERGKCCSFRLLNLPVSSLSPLSSFFSSSFFLFSFYFFFFLPRKLVQGEQGRKIPLLYRDFGKGNAKNWLYWKQARKKNEFLPQSLGECINLYHKLRISSYCILKI